MSGFRSPRFSGLRRPASADVAPLMIIALLSGALVLQVAAPPRTLPPEDARPAPRRLRMPVATPAPEYPAIVRAPLFSPDRTPGGVSGPSLNAVQLIGVAAVGRGRASVVLRAPDGGTHVIRTGEDLDGMKLVSAAADLAVFRGPSGTLRLRLGGPAAAAANPPVTP